jgi:prepilin-type N-terminal cleavage/methylation domain-containing protein
MAAGWLEVRKRRETGMQCRITKRRRSEQGFSLLEMMFATIILLVGLVAIAQLVPATILLNYRNRMDSSALVFAQRELDQMLDQPINPPGAPPQFTDTQGNICYLGDPTSPNTVQGSPIVVVNNQPLIDFGQAQVSNYSFISVDLTDPSRATYDVRWAVIITGNGSTVSAKRIILGVRQQGGDGYFQPITLDTMVQK